MLGVDSSNFKEVYIFVEKYKPLRPEKYRLRGIVLMVGFYDRANSDEF